MKTTQNETLHIYTRVSTANQVEGNSLEAQRKSGIEIAKSLNMNHEIHEERGASADSVDYKDRPVLKRLIDRCYEKKVKYIFVTELDRLTRDEMANLILKQIFQDNGIVVHTLQKRIDYNDVQDELITGLLTSVAHHENRMRAVRCIRGKMIAAENGKWQGGITPYGYTTNAENLLIIDEEEKEAHLDIVEWSLSGMGTHSISKKLNELGIPTKGSKYYKTGIKLKNKYTGKTTFKSKDRLLWQGGTVLAILKSTIFKGEFNFKGKVIPVPQIISIDKWDKIQNSLKNRRNGRLRPTKHFYLLKGIMKCNRCKRPLHGRIQPARAERSYRCASKRLTPYQNFCGMKSINIDKLNELVWNCLVHVFTNPELVIEKFKDMIDEYENSYLSNSAQLLLMNKHIKECEVQLGRLLIIYTEGEINKSQFVERKKEIESDQSENRAQKKELEGISSTSIEMGHALEWIDAYEYKIIEIVRDSSDEAKQNLIRTFVKEICVEYIDEEKLHAIEIELELPLFENDSKVEILLLKPLNKSNIKNIPSPTTTPCLRHSAPGELSPLNSSFLPLRKY